MENARTEKQIEASRCNGQKSRGPKTDAGRAVSRMNAVKHGIFSKEVVIEGLRRPESSREFRALHQRFCEELNPVGPREEMLVDEIVTAHWRLRRALKAESGEVSLSLDQAHAKRKNKDNPTLQFLNWKRASDPINLMEESSFGVGVLEVVLDDARMSVEKEGGLTPGAVTAAMSWFDGKPNRLTEELARFCVTPEDGMPDLEAREKPKNEVLVWLQGQLNRLARLREACRQIERERDEAETAAALLPAAPTLEKIQRYETKLQRQQHRAMIQLERLQRMREGEAVPAPIQVELGERG